MLGGAWAGAGAYDAQYLCTLAGRYRLRVTCVRPDGSRRMLEASRPLSVLADVPHAASTTLSARTGAAARRRRGVDGVRWRRVRYGSRVITWRERGAVDAITLVFDGFAVRPQQQPLPGEDCVAHVRLSKTAGDAMRTRARRRSKTL